jgi:C4-dicarboxylate-specific signal transduction histidine kinase
LSAALQEAVLVAPARNPAPAAERLLRSYLHKTSNSLCGIKGYAGLIASTDQDATKRAAWAQKIIREVECMEAIYRSVHDLTAPRGNPDRGVDLPRLLDDVFRVCETRCPGLQVLAGRLPAAELLLPKGDLCLVLTELLLNAWEGGDGTGRPARVEVTAAAQPTGRLALRLRDDGPGIDALLLGQVADPFVTTKDGHLGVGLTRVQTLLEMYDLAWSLDSVPGRGTTVTLEVAETTD